MNTDKFTKQAFLTLYVPLKMEGLSIRKIAKAMGINPGTLQKYKKQYALPNIEEGKEVMNAVNAQVIKDTLDDYNHSETVIETAYKLHLKGIQVAMMDNDYKLARDISIEALKIAKTEADIKRTFSLLVDNRQVNITVEGVPPDVMDEIRESVALEIYAHLRDCGLCDSCKKIIGRE